MSSIENLQNLQNIAINSKLRSTAGGFVLFKIDESEGKYKVRPITTLPPNKVVVPGSFNPVHVGHYLVGIKTVSQFNNEFGEDKNIIFELSATNFEKAPINNIEVKQRILYFLESYKNNYGKKVLNKVKDSLHTNIKQYKFYICITNAPLFVDKINVFGRNTIYAIGADTFVRIIAPFPLKDNNSKIRGLKKTLEGLILLRDNKSKLLVFDRPSINSVTETNIRRIKGKYETIIDGQLSIIAEILRNKNNSLTELIKSIHNTSNMSNIDIIENLIRSVCIKDTSNFNMNIASSGLRGKVKLPKYFNKGTSVKWNDEYGTVNKQNNNSHNGSHKYYIKKNNETLLSISSNRLNKKI